MITLSPYQKTDKCSIVWGFSPTLKGVFTLIFGYNIASYDYQRSVSVVRLSLQDVKKHVSRRGGELFVSLHLLRPGEQHVEIAALIAYEEQHLNHPRREFQVDEARALVGDYRLADCLIATLSSWYQWHQPLWEERLTEEQLLLLREAGIVSAVQLRLALFDEIQQGFQGFLPSLQREQVLAAFASRYSLTAELLASLLVLDREEEGLLWRMTEVSPQPDEVVARYNQQVFESALYNASEARFLIDCAAFGNTTEVLPGRRNAPGIGLGAVIKRLCFLARRNGVYYDLAYAEAASSETPQLLLTLYGPQETTGLPQQYGSRLARLCRVLLEYGLVSSSNRRGSSRLSSGAIIQAEATVHFQHRAYRFVMDAPLLKLLPPPEQEEEPVERHNAPGAVFDSGVEQLFAEAFMALESSQAVDGWVLEREPEPLLVEQGVFIPDFALTRDEQRIYMEILGFWTPSYRERKLQKLQQLRGRADLLLAIPEDARVAFQAVLADFPAVFYKDQLSASDVLQVMRSRYTDFSKRLEQLDRKEVRGVVSQAGFVPESQCYKLLHCYSRTEMAQAAALITNAEIAFVPGVGLYLRNWMEHLRLLYVEWLKLSGALPLAEVLQESRRRWPELAGCEDTALEALLGLWEEIHVKRASIFEATVELAEQRGLDVEEEVEPEPLVRTSGVKQVREHRSPRRKKETTARQENLWE